MQESSEHLTIKSGQKKVGRPFGSVGPNKLPSLLPEMKAVVSNNLTVTTGEVLRRKGRPYLETRCNVCGKLSIKALSTLRKASAGCGRCGNLVTSRHDTPKWLLARANAASERCRNPNNSHYHCYGGRGVQFLFSGPAAMAVWVQENLGLHRELQLNRIDNNGHYEPGNLEYCAPKINTNNNQSSRATANMHRFRLAHPEIRYADSTLVGLIRRGLSDREIVERFHKKSCKPKGVYGTFATPDLAIASLAKGF